MKFTFIPFLIIAIYFGFYRLGDFDLWQDEGETAIIAYYTTQTGLPVVTNGINEVDQTSNFFSQFKPGTKLERVHGWFNFYYTAFFLKLFPNIDGWELRIPWVILGIISLIIAYFAHPVGRLFAWTCLLSPALWMHFRQVRYYSGLLFFSILTLYGLWLLIRKGKDKNKKLGSGLLSIGIIGTYHCQSIQAFYLLSVIPILVPFSELKKYWRQLLMSVFIALCLTIPLGLYLESFSLNNKSLNPQFFKSFFEFHEGTLDAWFSLTPTKYWLGVLFCIWRIKKQDARSLAIRCAIAFLLTQMIVTLPSFGFHLPPRYSLAAIPLMMAPFMIWATTNQKPIKVFSILLIAFLLNRIPMRDFIRELREDHVSPNRLIAEFVLKEQSKNKNPNFIVASNYEELPLVFHLRNTNAQVVGGLLNHYEKVESGKVPDLLIYRNLWAPDFNQQKLNYYIKTGLYTEVALPVCDHWLEYYPEKRELPIRSMNTRAHHLWDNLSNCKKVMAFRLR